MDSHTLVTYAVQAAVGAAIGAGVVGVALGGSKEAYLWGAIGGALCGVVGRPVSDWAATKITGLMVPDPVVAPKAA